MTEVVEATLATRQADWRREHPVRAIPVGRYLLVHHGQNQFDRHLWTVSHRPTGGCILSHIETQQQAIAAAEVLDNPRLRSWRRQTSVPDVLRMIGRKRLARARAAALGPVVEQVLAAVEEMER